MQNRKTNSKAADQALENFATYWINLVSRQVQKRFEKSLRPSGYSLAYVGVARALDSIGPMLQRDLAIQYDVEQPTMAALLTRMERDGLVSRKPHPEDKRASLVSLTSKGRSKLPLAQNQLVGAANAATEVLTRSENETLILLLRKIADHMRDDA